ncbi:MAG TPA: SURF1 family protein, partial [Ottowia sp.]|nr:SURF1 family protein [Ottowia sp.]
MTARRIFLLAIALLGMAVTAGLGRWQLARAAEKEAVLAAEQAAETLPPVDAQALLAARSAADVAALAQRKVTLTGQWLGERTVYLDNRPMGQRSGFYVATPLRLDGGGADVLVLRGWVPRNFDNRLALP